MESRLHLSKEEVKLRINDDEEIEEYECEECGGIMVTSYGNGINLTYCVDCGHTEYDYDIE